MTRIRAGHVMPPPVQLPAEAEAHLEWLRRRNLSPATIQLRRVVLGMLVEHIAPTPLLEITAAQLEWFQCDVASQALRTTESTYVNNVRQWLSWAAKNCGTPDLSDVLIKPKLPRALPRPISEDDLSLAIANAPERIRPWLVLAAYAGLRAAEIASLRVEDVHLSEEPPWLLVLGKGAKERAVPLGRTVVDALGGLPQRGPAFPRKDGAPGSVTPLMVSKLTGLHLRSQGIEATLHQCRHRFATRVYRATGGDLLLTADLLGHSSVQTTRRYAAADASKGAAAVRALDVLGGDR